jgi:hypothetical protein
LQLAPAVAKVAVYFLLKANFRSSAWDDGAKVVEIPAGSFITSYARTAEACNLSVQQVRDAFTHLSRTQFATYTRTERWTLVTVLNWSAYQASDDEVEHAEEQALDQAENRQGTTDKELRIKNTNSIPSKTEGAGASAPLLIVSSETKGNPVKIAPKKPYHATLQSVARSIHERHPNNHGRRNCGVDYVERKLAAILKHKHVSPADCEDYLLRIDRNHTGMCNSEAWQQENGRFVPALRNYLATTEERYDVEPTPARKEPPRLMAV